MANPARDYGRLILLFLRTFRVAFASLSMAK